MTVHSGQSERLGYVLDVAGYGARSAREQADAEYRIIALVAEQLRDLGLELADTRYRGTGDGMLVFLPAEVDPGPALIRLLRTTSSALADDNRHYRDRLRLRMAYVLGPLAAGPMGLSGATVVEAARMVDSQVLRDALALYPAVDLVALVSDRLYARIVDERHTVDFRPVEVRAKEYRAPAWLWRGPGGSPVPARFGTGGPCGIRVMTGRILRVRGVDAWVNSENTEMEMARPNDFSVSSIIRYHGSRRDPSGRVVEDVIADELAHAVGEHRPVAPGSAFVTGAGALTGTNGVRWIVHVAAVTGEPGAGYRPVRDLGACVRNALAAADGLGVRTILIPVLGTGVGGGPVGPTAAELVDAASDYLTANPGTGLREISFLGYTDAERAALEHALRTHPVLRPVDATDRLL